MYKYICYIYLYIVYYINFLIFKVIFFEKKVPQKFIPQFFNFFFS